MLTTWGWSLGEAHQALTREHPLGRPFAPNLNQMQAAFESLRMPAKRKRRGGETLTADVHGYVGPPPGVATVVPFGDE
jgi:hypothetical protein